MQAFSEFRHMPPPFWAMVKYISETLGYTIRGFLVQDVFSEQLGHSILKYPSVSLDTSY